jgi:hypothetical protein
LAYQGAEVSELEGNQICPKDEFALAISKEVSPFAGTEKDGELVLPHPNKDPISQDIWLDSGTLRYLRDKTFEEGASAQE